eukprot:s3398_g11.t1
MGGDCKGDSGEAIPQTVLTLRYFLRELRSESYMVSTAVGIDSEPMQSALVVLLYWLEDFISQNAPCLFKQTGDSQWASAAELLASLMALRVLALEVSLINWGHGQSRQ